MMTSGTDLMRDINDGKIAIKSPEYAEKVRDNVSEAMNELVLYGARIRPLKIKDKKISCCGQVIGSYQSILNYCDLMRKNIIIHKYKPTIHSFIFNRKIKGWDQGIMGMKVGGKRKLIVPAHLAYGERKMGKVIPANSNLIFEIELFDVKTRDE